MFQYKKDICSKCSRTIALNGDLEVVFHLCAPAELMDDDWMQVFTYAFADEDPYKVVFNDWNSNQTFGISDVKEVFGRCKPSQDGESFVVWGRLHDERFFMISAECYESWKINRSGNMMLARSKQTLYDKIPARVLQRMQIEDPPNEDFIANVERMEELLASDVIVPKDDKDGSSYKPMVEMIGNMCRMRKISQVECMGIAKFLEKITNMELLTDESLSEADYSKLYNPVIEFWTMIVGPTNVDIRTANVDLMGSYIVPLVIKTVQPAVERMKKSLEKSRSKCNDDDRSKFQKMARRDRRFDR